MLSQINLQAFCLLLLLPLVAACTEAPSSAPTPERPVQVQRVTFRSGNSTRQFVGVVRARYETDLGFRIGGKIRTRVVNVGDRVRVGEVIARLDSQDLRLQAESAQAELSAATSNLTQAASDEARYATLKARGYAAVADYDRRKAAKDEAEGRLERAQRSLDLARNQVAYAELQADADGIITASLAEPGQVVSIGQPVVRLAHRGEMEALIALPESSLGEARVSQAMVHLWANSDRTFSARLRELSPQAEVATRTYAARFTIENPDEALALGMTATVTLSHATGSSFARLPLAAVLNRGTGPAVYTVDATGALVLRPVTVAAFTAEEALVTSGINDGDRVVTLGVQKLVSGQRVRAIE